jgi:hypothetical protein
VEGSADGTALTFKITLILTFFLIYVLSGGMIYILAFIRSLQIIVYWPILRIVLLGNIGLVFGIMIPFIMFDIIDPSIFEKFLTFDPEK